ncbi:MAG: response regulator [Thermodesulfobacteriota bacterium]
MMASKTILVVDDEAGIRSLLFELLSNQGYEVSVAKDGSDSLDQMKARRFDLLITDVSMPGIGGLELLKKMKEAGRRERVIVMTGEPIEPSDLGAELQPVFRLLQKPFPIQNFLDVVYSALAKSSRGGGKRGAPGRRRAQGCSLN